jgi:hypothetical protein
MHPTPNKPSLGGEQSASPRRTTTIGLIAEDSVRGIIFGLPKQARSGACSIPGEMPLLATEETALGSADVDLDR